MHIEYVRVRGCSTQNLGQILSVLHARLLSGLAFDSCQYDMTYANF